MSLLTVIIFILLALVLLIAVHSDGYHRGFDAADRFWRDRIAEQADAFENQQRQKGHSQVQTAGYILHGSGEPLRNDDTH